MSAPPTTRYAAVLALLAIATWMSCGRGNMNQDKDAEASPLVLVTRAPSPLQVGRAMPIEITLQNASSQPILVNGRMLVDEASGLPGRHELEPTLTGPDGKPVPFLQDVNAPVAAVSDLIELAPGAAVTRQLALDHYFRPTAPGTYRLELVYRNDPPLERNGRRAFVGRVRATPLELRLSP